MSELHWVHESRYVHTTWMGPADQAGSLELTIEHRPPRRIKGDPVLIPAIWEWTVRRRVFATDRCSDGTPVGLVWEPCAEGETYAGQVVARAICAACARAIWDHEAVDETGACHAVR